MNITSLLNALPGAVAQGLIWGVMAIGVYITYRVLDLADLTVDGSMATGGAVCVMLMMSGCNVWLALLCAIVAYNRAKSKWLMGLCRGLNVACGAFAVWRPACDWRAIGALACLVGGWTLYIAAVTKLSEGEERDSDGLGGWRFMWGLAAFVPLGACAFMPDPRALLLPAVGSFFAFLAWCVAVTPLGAAHAAADRRRAVGQTIRALLYLQVGYMLVVPSREFLAVAVALWVASRLARRLAPEISGS